MTHFWTFLVTAEKIILGQKRQGATDQAETMFTWNLKYKLWNLNKKCIGSKIDNVKKIKLSLKITDSNLTNLVAKIRFATNHF